MFIDNNELNDFIKKMERRKERFMNELSNNNSLLFIRYEEDPTGRHDLNEYDEKYVISYMDNLKILSGIFKKINPDKKIIILDVSHRHDRTEYLEECGIIKIKMRRRIEDWTKAGLEFEKTFSNETKFFDEVISKF